MELEGLPKPQRNRLMRLLVRTAHREGLPSRREWRRTVERILAVEVY
jgi:hypothetical protein